MIPFRYFWLGLSVLVLTSCRSGPRQVALPVQESAPSGVTESPESLAAEPAPQHLEQERNELRGVWVSRYDWNRPEELKGIIDRLQEIGSNTIFFQVRGTADAYYRSQHEPWAAKLSGKLGQNPGFDPLGLIVEEAHRRGMSVHAWLNTCTAWRSADPQPGRAEPEHLLRAHPQWLIRDRQGKPYVDGHGYLYFDPAHPDFRRHLLAVVEDLLQKYPLDGVHFDYFRYPAADLPLKGKVERLFRQARGERSDITPNIWRRQQLAQLLLDLYRLAHRLRPGIDVSVAVAGIYVNRWGWQNVVSGLDDFLQDSHLFVDLGALDTLVPMIYWPSTDPPGGRADFLTLLRDFAPLARKVRLLAGMSLQYSSLEELRRQMALAREHGYSGAVLFSFGLLLGKPVEAVRKIWLD